MADDWREKRKGASSDAAEAPGVSVRPTEVTV
jgi:hypothetical protein